MASILSSRICTRALATSYTRVLPRIDARLKSSSSSPKPPAGAPKDPVQPIPDAPKKPGNPSALSLDIDIVPEELASTQTGRTGAKSSKNSLSSFERRRRAMGRFALGAFGIGLAFGIFYLGREWEEEEKSGRSSVSHPHCIHTVSNTRPKEDMGVGRWGRTQARLTETTDVNLFTDLFGYCLKLLVTDFR
jgi:import inner membrane translocase subunit TIM50